MTTTAAKGAIQTITAKAAPDSASRLDLRGLKDGADFYLLFAPGRAADVVMINRHGGEFLIPSGAGGDNLYPSEQLRAEDAPFDFRADSSVELRLSLHVRV